MFVLYSKWESCCDGCDIQIIATSKFKEILKDKKKELLKSVKREEKVLKNWSEECKKILLDYMTEQQTAINWDKVFEGWDDCRRGVEQEDRKYITFLAFWVDNTYQAIVYKKFCPITDFFYWGLVTKPEPIFPKKPQKTLPNYSTKNLIIDECIHI